MCEEQLTQEIKSYVGIGASAGGVEALQELFLHMPPDTGASFIVVQHLSPDAVSMMDKILQKSSAMPVILAKEGMAAAPNHIYLNVPGMTLTIVDDCLHLEPAQSRNQLYMPINLMLSSLAAKKDARVLAVILSGSGSDGTLGVGAIKGSGGVVIAQKPTEAQYASMPQSVIAAGMADFVESTSLIGTLLHDYLKNPGLFLYGMDDSMSENRELSEDFKQVLNTVSLHSDIDFSSYKENTLLRRIERRISVNKFRGIEEYLDYIISSEREKEILYRDLLIGVTSFFRDGDAFLSLKENCIEPLLKRKKNIRLWSIACSTGEEAYSLAILVFECMERAQLHGEVKIFATDVDPDAISFAQRGIYPEAAVSGLPKDLLEKHFEATEHGYMINDNIRKMIIFAKHNIFKDAPFSRLDLIVCRNMFIYVKSEIQKQTLANFYRLLSEDGYLFLGSSESLGSLENAFLLLDKKWKLYQKNREYSSNSLLSFSFPDKFTEPGHPGDGSSKPLQRYKGSNIFEQILFTFAGPSVLTDSSGKIVQIIQKGGKYLSLQDGQFDSSIQSCFVPGLAALLEHILSQLNKDGSYQMKKKVTGLIDYPGEALNITVSHFQLKEGAYFLIQITEESIEEMAPSELLDLRELKDSRIQELEKSLGESSWNLKLAVEESDSRNEELQAANEELLASNEELQSTNEEMQSVNEELYTINAEYQSKILELTTANSDFDNLLLNAEVGALYIDENMKIRKITPIMLQNTNLLINDLERPVTHINFLDSYEDFIQDIETVSSERRIIEKEITDDSNITWLVRIRPYFEHTSRFGGVLVTMFDITKRLEAAKFELKRLIDSVPGGVLRMHFDEELIIDYANDSFYAMTDYTPEEFKKLFHNRYNRLIKPSDWVKLKENIQLSAKSGEILKGEYQLLRKDGSLSWNSMQAVIFKEDNEIELQCIITDISLLKEYEQQMEKERDYYNALYQNLVCGIVQYEITDHALRCYNANDEAFKMLGFSSPEEFRAQNNQTLQEVSHPDDIDMITQKLLSMKEVGECTDFEQRIVHKDGSIRWISGAAKVITTPDGKHLIQSTFMDVTDQKRSQEQLNKERDQYDKLYNMLYHMAVCGIIQADAGSKKILNINREALKILDEKDSSTVEAKIFAPSSQKNENSGLSSIGSLLLSLQKIGEQKQKKLSFSKKNKDTISIEGWANWIIDNPEQKIVQFTFLDITEREQLKEAEMKLKIATKASEAKSAFLSKMSHEIRTPMNGIVGMVDSAMLSIDDQERVRDCLGKMRRSMEHLQKLINDVLDMSHIESGKIRLEDAAFNLETLLADIVDEFSFSASEKGIFLRLVKEFEHSYISSDATRLREILGNLIGNAIKFTENCGKVTISAHETKFTEDISRYTFKIRDTGCGISPQDQNVIFELFEQGYGKNMCSGSGLGLAICKNLVEMLGGELSVTSAVGWGSEFCFTIPFKLSEKCDAEKPDADLSQISFDGFRVLLAEDNELNAEIAETFLKAYGFDVIVCKNGREACEKFNEQKEGYFDLILLDIQMPVMNGYEAARKIRSFPGDEAARIPILAMSANAFAEDIEAAISSGMNGHIAKPVNIENLIMPLERFLHK